MVLLTCCSDDASGFNVKMHRNSLHRNNSPITSEDREPGSSASHQPVNDSCSLLMILLCLVQRRRDSAPSSVSLLLDPLHCNEDKKRDDAVLWNDEQHNNHVRSKILLRGVFVIGS